ncbi:unnamed protein product [Boreogadus saida]
MPAPSDTVHLNTTPPRPASSLPQSQREAVRRLAFSLPLRQEHRGGWPSASLYDRSSEEAGLCLGQRPASSLPRSQREAVRRSASLWDRGREEAGLQPHRPSCPGLSPSRRKLTQVVRPLSGFEPKRLLRTLRRAATASTRLNSGLDLSEGPMWSLSPPGLWTSCVHRSPPGGGPDGVKGGLSPPRRALQSPAPPQYQEGPSSLSTSRGPPGAEARGNLLVLRLEGPSSLSTRRAPLVSVPGGPL